jgi:polyphosphate kinase
VDSAVLAIKLTIYRTGRRSPIIQVLKEAARRGKQVAVLVEITARFDEAPNISWARSSNRRELTSPTAWSGSRRTSSWR